MPDPIIRTAPARVEASGKLSFRGLSSDADGHADGFERSQRAGRSKPSSQGRSVGPSLEVISELSVAHMETALETVRAHIAKLAPSDSRRAQLQSTAHAMAQQIQRAKLLLEQEDLREQLLARDGDCAVPAEAIRAQVEATGACDPTRLRLLRIQVELQSLEATMEREALQAVTAAGTPGDAAHERLQKVEAELAAAQAERVELESIEALVAPPQRPVEPSP